MALDTRSLDCLVPVALGLLAAPASAQSFHTVQALGGNYSEVRGVSNHYGASVAAGVAINPSGQARGIWYLNQLLVDVGSPGGLGSIVNAISEGATYLVGTAQYEPANSWTYRAVRWIRYGPALDLGTLGGCCSAAEDVSSNGEVVVGTSADAAGEQRAFRWTQSSGMQPLAGISGFPRATAVDASGTVIVGSYLVDGPNGQESRAFRWTQDAGASTLASLADRGAHAADVSRDGQVVVGTSLDLDWMQRPVVWTEGAGIRALPIPVGCSGGTRSVGPATYGWGWGPHVAIGGWMTDPAGVEHAVIWREDLGMVDLAAFMRARGALPSGWESLASMTAISADGHSVGGYGTFNGQRRGFMAVALSFDSVGCEGDVDLDSAVSGSDISAVLAAWGPSPGQSREDINGDGWIDGADLGMILSAWGLCP